MEYQANWGPFVENIKLGAVCIEPKISEGPFVDNIKQMGGHLYNIQAFWGPFVIVAP